MKRRDLIGIRFGRLLVVKLAFSNGRLHWECKCDCKKKTTVSGADLTSGNTKSCGCLGKEGNNKTHGASNTKIYFIYNNMMDRCYNERVPDYRGYGGRGIEVCKAWHKFENFYVWYLKYVEKNGPIPRGWSLDRRNNDGNYDPRNCRFASAKVQANNRRARIK